jgi:hypothetical protein
MLYTQVMLAWLRSWSGLSSRLLVWPLVLMFTLTLMGCGMSPLSLLAGGGTNVAANTQAGKQNNQTIGTSTVQELGTQTVTSEKVNNSQVQTNRVNANDVQTVVVNEVPAWVILLLVVGWILPSPGEIGRIIRGWFRG